MADVFENVVIKTRWRLDRLLGKGAFGAVYAGLDLTTGAEIAIKIEHPSCKKQLLKLEISLLRKLQKDNPYAAEFIACGKFIIYKGEPHYCSDPDETDNKGEENGSRIYWYVVMSLLGESLNEYKKRFKDNILEPSEAAKLGIDMIRSVEKVHKIGFLHRDIKPANFCLPLAVLSNKPLCLIDYGLARRFCSAGGVLREPRKKVGFRGTARYASVRAHEGKELGRVDDLWSLFYTVLELMIGHLPWKGKDRDKTLELKRKCNVYDLMSRLPYEMIVFYEYLNLLTFDKEPDYCFLVSLCSRIIDPSLLVNLPKEFPPHILKLSHGVANGISCMDSFILSSICTVEDDKMQTISPATTPVSASSPPSLNDSSSQQTRLTKSRAPPPGLAVLTGSSWQQGVVSASSTSVIHDLCERSSPYDGILANPYVTSESCGTNTDSPMSTVAMTGVAPANENTRVQPANGALVFSPASSSPDFDSMRQFSSQATSKIGGRELSALQRKPQFPMRINTVNVSRETFNRSHNICTPVMSPTCHTSTEQVNSPTLYSPMSPFTPESPTYAVYSTHCVANSSDHSGGTHYNNYSSSPLSASASSSTGHTMFSSSNYVSNGNDPKPASDKTCNAICANSGDETIHAFYPKPPPLDDEQSALPTSRKANPRLRRHNSSKSNDLFKVIHVLPSPQTSCDNIVVDQDILHA